MTNFDSILKTMKNVIKNNISHKMCWPNHHCRSSLTTTHTAELRIENETTGIRQKTGQGDFPALQLLDAYLNNGEGNARDAQTGFATPLALFRIYFSARLPLVTINTESLF